MKTIPVKQLRAEYLAGIKADFEAASNAASALMEKRGNLTVKQYEAELLRFKKTFGPVPRRRVSA